MQICKKEERKKEKSMPNEKKYLNLAAIIVESVSVPLRIFHLMEIMASLIAFLGISCLITDQICFTLELTTCFTLEMHNLS